MMKVVIDGKEYAPKADPISKWIVIDWLKNSASNGEVVELLSAIETEIKNRWFKS